MKNIRKILIYLAGLAFISVGLIFSMRSCIGTTVMLSLPYTLSLLTNIGFGAWTLIFLAGIILMLFIFKHVTSRQKLATGLITAVLFSLMIWGFNKLLFTIYRYDQYTVRLTYTLFCIFFISLGFAFLKQSEVLNDLLPEDIYGIIAKRTGKTAFNIEFVFYVSLILVSVIISLMFSKRLESIREGTLLMLICIGPLTEYFRNVFEKSIDSFIDKDKGEEKKQTVFIPSSVEAVNEAYLNDIIKSIDVSKIEKPEDFS